MVSRSGSDEYSGWRDPRTGVTDGLRTDLAAFGLLSPVIAGAAMAFSSVSVGFYALTLRRWRGAATEWPGIVG